MDADKLDNKQIYKMIQDMLSHDKVMARCVLGKNQSILEDYEDFKDLSPLSLWLIEWMGDLLTLAGAFLYSKFNQWRSETGAHPAEKEQPNALYLKRLLEGVQNTDEYFDQASSGLRVLRVLDGLYDSFDMNFLVIKYLIINSQIEAGFNFQEDDDDRCGLSQLIGFPNEKSFRVTCNPAKEFRKRGQNLAAAFNFISIYRSDPNRKRNFDIAEVYPSSDIKCAFAAVFQTMEFMKRIRLDIDSEGNVNFIETTADGGEKKIHSHGVVRVFETKDEKCTGVYKSGMDLPKNFIINFYLLERIEYIQDNAAINAAVSFLYQSFNENDSISVYFSEKEGLVPEGCDPEDGGFTIASEKPAVEYFKRISGYLPGTRSVSSFFRGMITTHYRYHNVLAPSIVDAIDEDHGAKIRVLKQYVKNDETPFKEAMEPTFKTLEFALTEIFDNDWKIKIDRLCDYISSDAYGSRRIIDWDTLIARILIYEGPSEIIRTVLLPDNVSDNMPPDAHDKAYHEIKKIVYRVDDKKQIEKVCDQIIAGLEMRYIDNIFEAKDVSQSQKKRYDGEYKDKIDEIKTLFPGDYAVKMECKYLAQSYIDTIVKELTAIEKKDDLGANNKFAENSIQDTLEVLENYKQAKSSLYASNAFLRTIKAFLSFYAGIFKSCRSRMSYEFEKSATILSPEKIRERQDKIEDEFFKGVYEKAAALSGLFCKENAVELALRQLWEFAASTDDVRYYYAVLARAPINSKKLANIFRINDNGKGTIIFNPDERQKIDFETAENDGKIIEYLGNIIRFLAYGGDDDQYEKNNRERNLDKSNYTGYKEYAKKVIYPQIVTFAKHREDCDANDCLIMDHSGAFAQWHEGEVQILTEFKYIINHSYYAMPNLNRIETEWWVDPILVSCYKFDEEVRKASSGVNAK